MTVCTFFGHRDCPSSIEPNLKQALIHLIDAQSVDTFYVGNHGAFDAMVRSTLAELMQDYHHAISYRNKWMLKQSHFVVTYITHDWGGAAQFASLAKKQKKTVLNLTK